MMRPRKNSRVAELRNSSTNRALIAAGGVSALARRLGISRQAVSQWEEIPPGRRTEIASITGIPVAELV